MDGDQLALAVLPAPAALLAREADDVAGVVTKLDRAGHRYPATSGTSAAPTSLTTRLTRSFRPMSRRTFWSASAKSSAAMLRLSGDDGHLKRLLIPLLVQLLGERVHDGAPDAQNDRALRMLLH